MLDLYHYTPQIWMPLAVALVSILLANYAWRNRTVPGATPYALSQIFAVITYLTIAFGLAAISVPLKIHWRQLWAISLLPSALIALALALEYARLDKRVSRRQWLLLSLPFIITVLIVFTNDKHHLMWTDFIFDESLQVSRGWWNKGIIAYSYLLKLSSVIILVNAFRKLHGFYRWQAGLLIIGGLLGWIGQALDFLLQSQWLGVDLAVWRAVGGKLVVATALFLFRAFDLTPIARRNMVEQMSDGMIILDNQQRIIDLNPAAQQLLRLPAKNILGQPVAQIGQVWPDLFQLFQQSGTNRAEIVLGDGIHQRIYAVIKSKITDRYDAVIGQMIVWRDITELKQAQKQQVAGQRVLATLTERERLARELHDSLGQSLAAIHIQTETAVILLDQGRIAQTSQTLAQLSETTLTAQTDVREYLLGVKIIAAKQDFFTTIREYEQQFSLTYDIPIKLVIPADLEKETLSPTLEIQLFRIIQEALTNVRKHATASAIEIVFSQSTAPPQIKITITDDGKGFDPLLLTDAHRYGLYAMKSRAEAINGIWMVESTLGQGTEITVLIPFGESQ